MVSTCKVTFSSKPCLLLYKCKIFQAKEIVIFLKLRIFSKYFCEHTLVKLITATQKTPLEIAMESKNSQLIDLLRSHFGT